jgi:hypothetical protein
MGRKTAKSPDYSAVIDVIEHYLQFGSGSHPYENHEESARATTDGDAWRALVEIGEALDRAKKRSAIHS